MFASACIQYLYGTALVKHRRIHYNIHSENSVENRQNALFPALSLYRGFCILYAFSTITAVSVMMRRDSM